MWRPSGEYATDHTQLVCPSRGSPAAAPVSASQIRIVLSSDPETMCRPSGEYATDRTKPVCPSRGSPTAAPFSASHIPPPPPPAPHPPPPPSNKYTTNP